MAIQTVTDAIRYVGVDDNTLALFENQYPVQPMGVSYNSYVILDEKIAVMDSVDARAAAYSSGESVAYSSANSSDQFGLFSSNASARPPQPT